MFKVSWSEFGIVLFILVLVLVAGRVPMWGERVGYFFYRRWSKGKPSSGAPSAPRQQVALRSKE